MINLYRPAWMRGIIHKFLVFIAHNGARAIRLDAQGGARARRSGMAYSPSYAKAAQRTKRNSGGPAPRYAKAAQRILHNLPAVYDSRIFLPAGVWSERGNERPRSWCAQRDQSERKTKPATGGVIPALRVCA